tara:strand:- start:9992 stop:10204 length:213 start_codon:yes stop_codon:yes gene_type:complete
MTTYASYLRRSVQNENNRWIVKFDSENLIKEVKLIYNPKEYRKMNGKHKLLTKEKLLEILDDDKKNRSTE